MNNPFSTPTIHQQRNTMDSDMTTTGSQIVDSNTGDCGSSSNVGMPPQGSTIALLASSDISRQQHTIPLPCIPNPSDPHQPTAIPANTTNLSLSLDASQSLLHNNNNNNQSLSSSSMPPQSSDHPPDVTMT